MKITLLLTLLASLLLSACGQMGPLYLPEEQLEDQSAGQQEAPSANKQESMHDNAHQELPGETPADNLEQGQLLTLDAVEFLAITIQTEATEFMATSISQVWSA